MLPKEILFQTLRHESVETLPWVPFAGVHAGKLTGFDAEEVLKDGDKLFESLMEVNRLYKPMGQPVIFDLQLEAECLGCELLWSKDCPPTVRSHPYAGDDYELPPESSIPDENSGRLPLTLSVMRRMKEAVGDTTALYGLICGPLTLASHLRGNDIFMDMFDDDEYVHELLQFCVKTARRMSRMFADAGMDVIAVVDPLVSQISEKHFVEFLHGPYTEIFEAIREMGVFSSFFVCGDATRNIEAMCRTAPDSISVDENVDLAEAKKTTDRYNIAIGGNIPLTTVMLHGTQQDNMKFVVDLIDSIEDKRNLIIAPGCDMPYDIPVENAVGAAQAVLHTDEVREMVKNYIAVEEDVPVELPDYSRLNKPLVEVFTLDSATCAACTYMMGAANAAKEEFGERIDMVEYKYTVRENIARCRKMGVPNLPSMYINGELKFRSIIPDREALREAILAAEEAVK